MLKPFILLVIVLLNAGCGDSDNKTAVESLRGIEKKQVYKTKTTIKGKVSNKAGPIKRGSIIATNLEGDEIASTELTNSAQYLLELPSNTELPIILTFQPKVNSPFSKLTAVAIYSSITKYDINELTTVIAKKAKKLGGYTHSHMIAAAQSTVSMPDANKTTAGFKGDPTKQYGGWH